VYEREIYGEKELEREGGRVRERQGEREGWQE
jgi:hypothetical protein